MTYFVTWHDVYDVIMLSNVYSSLTCLVRNDSGSVCEHALHTHANNHKATSVYLAQGGGRGVGKARILSLLPGIRANTVKWRELSKSFVNLLIMAPDL